MTAQRARRVEFTCDEAPVQLSLHGRALPLDPNRPGYPDGWRGLSDTQVAIMRAALIQGTIVPDQAGQILQWATAQRASDPQAYMYAAGWRRSKVGSRALRRLERRGLLVRVGRGRYEPC